MKKKYKLFKYWEKNYHNYKSDEDNILLIVVGEKVSKSELLFFEENNFIVLEIESYLKNEKDELLFNYVDSYMDEVQRTIKENTIIYPEEKEIKEDFNKNKTIKQETIDDLLAD